VAAQAHLLDVELARDRGHNFLGTAAHFLVGAGLGLGERVERRFADRPQPFRRRLTFFELVAAELLDEALDFRGVGSDGAGGDCRSGLLSFTVQLMVSGL
jgi:hypothetical protein